LQPDGGGGFLHVCADDEARATVGIEKLDTADTKSRTTPAAARRDLEELRAAINYHRREGHCEKIIVRLTVAEQPFFRQAFKRIRCLITVSGYYEWHDTPSGKQPWYFTARDDARPSGVLG
jgi:putative SOS response-associated peptidase YedK